MTEGQPINPLEQKALEITQFAVIEQAANQLEYRFQLPDIYL